VYGSTAVFWSADSGREFSRLTVPNTAWGLLHLAFHPDGRRVLLIGRGASAQVWDVRDRVLLGEVPGENQFGGGDFSPNGRTLAVSRPGELLLLDADTLAALRRAAQPLPAHSGDFRVTRFSTDGSRLAVVLGPSIALLDGADLSLRSSLVGHSQRIRDVAFSPDGAQIASVSWDRTVRVWNCATGDQEQCLPGHREQVSGVGFVAAGTRIMSSSSDGTVHLWDTHPRPVPVRLDQEALLVTALFFTPDGRRLVSSGGNSLRTWDVESGLELTDRRILATNDASTCALSQDGRTLAYELPDHGIQLVDVQTGTHGPVLRGHTRPMCSIRFSPDGTRAATSASDMTIRTWDTASGALLHTITGTTDEASGVRFSPDGSRLVSAMFGFRPRFWDASTGAELPGFPAGGVTTCAEYSPDAGLLACGDETGAATLFEASSGKVLHTMTGMKPVVWSVSFSPDGTRLATGSQDRTVRIWDVRTGRELLVLRGHTGSVVNLAWSRDGRRLASAGYDGAILVWDSVPMVPGAQ
jgi:WD40 repeat protein